MEMIDIITEFSFILGFFITIILFCTTFIFWLLGVINNIKVEEVNLYFGFSRFFLFKKKVGTVLLSLGFLPTGSFVKYKGVFTDDSLSTPNANEFRAQSNLVKLTIVFINPILLAVIGIILIWQSESISIIETSKHWLRTSIFLQSLDDGKVLWDPFFTDYKFLFGCLTLLSSFGGVVSNISMIKKRESIYFSILTLTISIIIFIPLIRLMFTYMSFKSTVLFFLSSLAFGAIAMLIFYILAKAFRQLSN